MDQSMWIIFGALVVGFLFLDLGVLNRKAHVIKFREALAWSGFWISLALSFCVFVYFRMGKESAVTFLTAYVIELSLSVDNLFVFLLIFASFRIPQEYQHRVLFWGIIGALVMRAVCIGAGVVMLQKFGWLMYVFGAILIWGGIKTGLKKEDDNADLHQSFAVRMIKKFIPVTTTFDGQKFFTIENGKKAATPLFLALIVVEVSDLVFAVDSIPAVLAISQDPFIVYTSNVFAILGLRSLYFALSHLMNLFHYLKYALSVILVFVGCKIIAQHVGYKLPTEVALGIVVGMLALAIVASLIFKKPADPSKDMTSKAP